MGLSVQFLDELRARTVLSALVGATVKLTRAGQEYKGCCPFHHEKTPSFYVNDDKGFYHCFGCSAHGDAIRWLTDQRGLPFVDAVRELADAAGMVVPAPSREQQARETAASDMAATLTRAADWYADQLDRSSAAQAVLAARGVDMALARRFGLGLAPPDRSVSACGVALDALAAAGLMVRGDDGWRDRFRRRIMIPIHDARGRVIAFGGRHIGDTASAAHQVAKYVNSPEGPHFDKGRTLFNLHRAAPAARATRRLIIVEGYFDVIALAAIGIEEAVAPMGTALTEHQLDRAWRVHHCPTLMLDGDAAGQSAAMRACERAMPALGPGASLSIAMLPRGDDPDTLARRPLEQGGGRDGVEAVLSAARPLSTYVFDMLVAA